MSPKEKTINPKKTPRITKEARKPAPKKQAPKKSRWVRWFAWFSILSSLMIIPVAAAIFYVITIYPKLPDPATLKEVTYQVPLRILTQDGKLISEIGTKKRLPLEYHEIPERMTQAIIASEDENFFEHGGVDFKGLGRAVYDLITTGHKKSGGSTITMQVARNFFLSKEKTYLRKLNEIILSYKIENELSKQEILALYINKIFLGYRSYGVGAAAQTYYGKSINDLSLDEYAMIAGLPKAPSAYNPLANAERAKLRRNYVLRRMYELNFISEEQMQQAQAVEVHASLHSANIDVKAGYVAEMARQFALEKFGEEALDNGLTIVTTLDSRLQEQANDAVYRGLQTYERRHGYRGPVKTLDANLLQDNQALLDNLKEVPNYGDLKAGVVTGFKGKTTQVMMESGDSVDIPFNTMEWAAPYKSVNYVGKKPTSPKQVLKVGDVIYLEYLNKQWQLAQDPKTESSLVSLDTNNGRVLALVGGFDYFRSKFNRATQGRRQVGSNMKPFLYSFALENGMTAATTINDAPVVFKDNYREDFWRPENYSGRYYGPTRLRKALAYSRNLVSIRLMQKVGIDNAIGYFQNFGYPLNELNQHKDLSLALGSAQFTPWEVARAYATFANTGYLIDPYIIQEVRNYNGEVLYQAKPKQACREEPCEIPEEDRAPRTIDPLNAYIMTDIMQDVIRVGSGKRARALKREDIAGKTGTTNDQKDAWFSGFNPNVVTTVWVGFDQPSTLGRSEVGGRAALPIWMDYMQDALKPYPNIPFPRPEGIVNVPIDPETGQAVPPETANAIYEIFREDRAPEIPKVTRKQIETITNELFD
ncbi:penicillin-binding protein 1A [Thiomicrorhabdus heinhorstiae]|uniref:Penicillin-binding protein 1A n=1 Tax=Thiomicrorhabdus heinhorstiae TaxID=2748010 RepID=A0ABS0C0H5_9GAMM|nr:penicillin-binding protein 1A [Thiomicrorhabdus heinhorstiae]MBF6058754.1 penicillin-binding protein 1A [Thiomicrorhabdus heinhorstiae]